VKKSHRCAVVGISASLLFLSLPLTAVNAVRAGQTCSKVGAVARSKQVSFVCTRKGKRLIWQLKSNSGDGKNSSVTTTTAGSVTATTAVRAQTFFAPSVLSDGLGICEIEERSVHRATYPKGPYVGFPRRPINDFKNSGVLNFALIPLDWSDLPGSETRRQEGVKQAGFYKYWMETASQGRVRIDWKIHTSWVRMPGASASWYTVSAYPPNVEFARAAISAADQEFNFTSIDAVVFYLPDAQNVFLEGSQGTVDSGLARPFQTAEGSVSSFAIAGAYFDLPYKTYWSVWVHFSLIWMGMAELFDARANRGGFAERAIPVGNMQGYDVMSSQDGPFRQLSGWLRFLLGWLEPNQVFCKNLDNTSAVKLSLDPVGSLSTRLKLVGIRVSDTKLIAIESRRFDEEIDCVSQREFKKDGVIVYIVDSTKGHTSGETLSLVSPVGRPLKNYGCSSPPMQDSVLSVGDYVDVLGLRIKVMESNTFDTIEITRP
jgi:hypothetical protein